MKLEQILEAGILRSDLVAVDAYITASGISNASGFVHLKASLVTLATVSELDLAARPTYQYQPDPAALMKPIKKNLKFAAYLRNKFVGHIHQDLIAKAVEWQPMLRSLTAGMQTNEVAVFANLWILETAINTYVDEKGKHLLFESETDLTYPPDWKRFLDFLEITIRGSIAYLEKLIDVWAPKLSPEDTQAYTLKLARLAGNTEFRYLAK